MALSGQFFPPDKAKELRKLGINPIRPNFFEINATAKDIHENYERSKLDYKTISIASRSMRQGQDMNPVSFAELQELRKLVAYKFILKAR